jgi:Holliday junction resolvasome RuvABC endonuclease subunit
MNLIGVDLGIHKVTVAAIGPGELDAQTLLYADTYTSAEQDRCVQLRELGSWVRDSTAFYQPEYLFYENVLIGNNRAYSLQLAETKGAVLAGLAELVRGGLQVIAVNTQTWKKQVIGSGHASKEDVKNYIDGTHPSYSLLCGRDQDAYDACCIGIYGLDLLERAEQIEL